MSSLWFSRGHARRCGRSGRCVWTRDNGLLFPIIQSVIERFLPVVFGDFALGRLRVVTLSGRKPNRFFGQIWLHRLHVAKFHDGTLVYEGTVDDGFELLSIGRRGFLGFVRVLSRGWIDTNFAHRIPVPTEETQSERQA